MPLARHFLPEGTKLASDACDALKRHAWPGNVRELKNVLSRAALLAAGARAARRRPGAALDRAGHRRRARSPDDRGRAARARGVIAQAAAELGMSRQTLYRRMEKLGIARE